jgi:integrase
MIDGRTVSALAAVAERINALLPVLIVLADSTGRRVSSILGLRWDDFDFERETIHWRPELDKRRRSWVTPMPKRAREALQRFRSAHPSIGSALVFPSARDANKPVSVYVAEAWLERAYEAAELAHPRGGLWHMFRRKWATERKTYPLKDVAAAGGWSDVHTLLTCYQQPDERTLRAVVEGEQLTQKLTQVT